MVIELVTFRLVRADDEAAFLAADRRLQTEFFYQQPGLLRRTTARGADGEWLVVTLWDSLEDAECAALAVPEEFMAFIDHSSYEIKRYTSLD